MKEKKPYTKYLKQPVPMRLERDSVEYFNLLATEIGASSQTPINLYLRDCVIN